MITDLQHFLFFANRRNHYIIELYVCACTCVRVVEIIQFRNLAASEIW